MSVTRGIVDPAYLALSPDRKYLYSVNETPTTDGQPGGAVSAFAIDPATGCLTFLNQEPSHGSLPCFVVVDATGSVVLVVNHDGGNVAAFPIKRDGSLGAASDVVQHSGSSVDPRNQLGPHPHSVNIGATNRFALVCDKGTDKVMVYRIDRPLGKLVPNDPPWVSVQPGRHRDVEALVSLITAGDR